MFVRDDGNGNPDYSRGASKARQKDTDHEITEQQWADYRNLMLAAPASTSSPQWDAWNAWMVAQPEFQAAADAAPPRVLTLLLATYPKLAGALAANDQVVVGMFVQLWSDLVGALPISRPTLDAWAATATAEPFNLPAAFAVIINGAK